ncbi:MAG: recombination mediator RecR [bacterium]
MKYSSKVLERVITSFSALPGIGEKSAQRIALYLLQGDKQKGEVLAQSVLDLYQNIGYCSICFNLTEQKVCEICSNPKRDHSTICVVNEHKDLLAIERTGHYNGIYHVLGGMLSPLDGVEEKDLKIEELIQRINAEIEEVILAINPTIEGEMTSSRLFTLLEKKKVKVTRIARGIPFGACLEFNDNVTISKALEDRVIFNK